MKRLNKSKYKVFIYIHIYAWWFMIWICVLKSMLSQNLRGRIKRSRKFNILNFLIEKYRKALHFFCALYLWKKGGKKFSFSLLFFPFHVIVCHNVAQTHKFNSFSRSMTLHCVVLRKVHNVEYERENENNAKFFFLHS